ncbi:MAG: TIGR04086 family membrane protein [Eubacteriales bacterium]|nr:TIGR04086 family membrane protein [Eubacteriales bacterium]
MPRTRKSAALALLKGLLIAVALTLACMLLMAAALVALQMSDRLLTVLNQIVKLLAIAVGTCVAVPRGGSRGLLTGVEIALVYMALGYAMYVLLGGGSFAVGNMLGEMLLGSAVGAVTGAVRANLSPRRSRIRA